MGEPMIVLGAGGHALSVVSAALLAGFDISGIYDDDPEKIGQDMFGVPIVGTIAEAPQTGLAFVAIGDNALRRAIVERSAYRYATVIHPDVVMGHDVEIGEGAIVMGGCIVQPRAIVGSHAILSAGTMIPHEGNVGPFAHIGPGVAIGGAARIGASALIGTGASLLPGIAVGEGAIVGAGAVVLHDVAAGTTVVGNPAKTIRT